jgi:phospho-N-acetylmuramoyl-pentapeptide-transferase
MARVLAAALVAMIIAILAGPTFITFLRRNEFGQQIREEGPERHAAKQGTPTLGGLLLVLAATVAFLPLSYYTAPALTVLGTALACGAIGFLDDWTKLRHKRSLGLNGRWKMLLLVGVTVAVGFVAHHQHLRHAVFVPIADKWIWLGPAWYVLLFFVIAGAVNGVNLADGLDGLAAGTSIIALATFTAMAVTIYIRDVGPNHHRIENRLDVAFIGAALIGGAIGFLWFNAFPAELFMGDTGAMALGGAMAAMAIMMKVELLLIFVGGIFLIEAVSVMLQVLSFKWWGRRIFLIAPVHHHFEMKARSETKIMVRFWIVTAILCAAGFALFYKYYPNIRPTPRGDQSSAPTAATNRLPRSNSFSNSPKLAAPGESRTTSPARAAAAAAATASSIDAAARTGRPSSRRASSLSVARPGSATRVVTRAATVRAASS